MSKKAERVKRSFAKQWLAAISGSMFLVSMQSANASQDRAHGFREFRNSNPDVPKGEAHRMFRAQHGAQAPGAGGITAVAPITNIMWMDKNGIVRCGTPPARMLREPGTHHIRHQSTQALDGSIVRLNSGVDLNLSSGDRNITLGQNLFNNVDSVTITIGGESKTVAAGTQVSSAEYVAVKQVLSGHGQGVTLDSSGRATGGEIDLNSISNPGDVMRASSLVIPERVTTYGAFGHGSEIKLTGDLDNFGSLYAVANGKHGGTLHADDITNHSGALISSSMKAFTVLADGNLTNDGTITSAGDLSLAAGSSLTNSGEVSAKHDVSLNAASINNSGSVSSTAGNITLDGPSTVALSVNNSGGQMAALQGAINIRNADYDGTSGTTVTGGDLLSKQVNLNAGKSMADVNVSELTGELNQKGLGAHVQASTDLLNIGTTCLTGDPTYYNTAGGINIGGSIKVGEALTLIARGNITSANGITIEAADAVTGYPITMIAGVNITFVAGGADQPTVGPIPPANPNFGNVIVQTASSTGGGILLGTNVTITTTGAAGPGGDVQFVAFEGPAVNSGKVDLSGTTITTNGNGAGSSGSVEVIAGAQNTTAISVFNINTTAFGTGTPGDITLTTAQPFVSGAGISVGFLSNGSIVGADFYAPSNFTGVNAGINLGNFGTGNLTTGGGNLSVRLGGTLSSGAAINSGSVTFNSDGSIFVSGNITANSIFSAFADGNFTQTGTSAISVNGAGGIAGVSILGNISGNNSTLLRAENMFLFSTNGRVGTSGGLKYRIDADNLTINATSGSAFINDLDTIDVDTSNVGGTLDISSGDLMDVVSDISGDIIKLTSADQILVNANISSGQSATLHAASDIVGPGTVSGANVILQCDTLSVGGTGNPLNLAADNLSLFVPGGNAFLSEADVINFGGGNTFVSGDLFLDSAVGITSSSIITAGSDINFDTGTFNLASLIAASQSITLTSANALLNSNISGTLQTDFLSLRSVNGNVGTSAALPFTLNAGPTKVSVNSTNQSVFVRNLNTNGIELTGSTANLQLNFASNGPLTVSGALTSTNDVVTISAANKTLQLNNAITINAKNGINITNTGITASDKIAIGKDVTMATTAKTAGLGVVNITLGTPVAGKPKKAPKNVVIVNTGPGIVKFTGKGATAVTPVNTLTAQGANVNVSNSINAKNLTFGGNVNITADPPVAADAVTEVIIGGRSNSSASVAALPSAPDQLSTNSPALMFSNVGSDLSDQNLNSSGALMLATLPNTLAYTPLTSGLDDDSYMMTSSPLTQIVDGKLLSQTSFFASEESQGAESSVGLKKKQTQSAGALQSEMVGGVHTLNNGNALVVASEDTTVVSPFGTVKLKANSIAFIMANEGQLSVYDLDDHQKASVIVETAGREIVLTPGRHCTVTSANATHYAEINPVETIAHRAVSRQKGSEITLFQSEFSLPSALTAIKPLRELIESEHSEAKKLALRMMKTSAILLQIGSAAPYEVQAKPRMVALNRNAISSHRP